MHAADNLEAHLLGGFSGSFSSKSVCRFCHIQYLDLETHIHDYDGDQSHSRWTVQEYDSIAGRLPQQETDEIEEQVLLPAEGSDDDESDDDVSESEDEEEEEVDIETWGVKSLCPLNVLQSFHCTEGFVPDLMHNLLEGVISEDLLSIVRALSSKGWFSVEAYNKQLRETSWKSSEAADKPQLLPSAKNARKLKGKVISQ